MDIDEGVECVHCGGDDVIRHGKTRNGKQRLKFKECRRVSREERQDPRYSEDEKDTILRAYLERPEPAPPEWTMR